MARLIDVIRVVHPGPTLLNAAAALTLAEIAGASSHRALLAAVTMLGAHAFIGTLNDLIDRHVDRARREKPIAAGRISVRTSAAIAAIALLIGLAAAIALGPLTLIIATLGIVLGVTYNLGVKRSVLSWLPFALGVALIPPFAWAAAEAPLPAAIRVLSLAAITGGAALAMQNGLADRAIDTAVGLRGAVVQLGDRRAWIAAALLHLCTLIVVFSTLSGSLGSSGGRGAALLIAGAATQVVSLVLSTTGQPSLRRRGWEAGGIGLLLLAIAVALEGAAT
ncbi:MAG: UbiA family prenyltransferase [Candidatus Limnocylindrus sp.]|jgi:4-hydroxybenzoate polyprenyltransferase